MTLLKLAWRNAWRSPRRTAITLMAVALGLAGALLSMAVNYGMVHQMVQTAIATELGHLQVHARGYAADPALALRLEDGGRAAARVLDRVPEVVAWAPRARAEGLVSSPRASAGVRIVGVDPVREAAVSLLADSLVEGEWLGRGPPRRIAIGRSLAVQLQVGLGDKLVVSVQDLTGDLTGRAYRVGAIFATASRDLDAGVVFLPLDAAQSLFALGDAISEVVVLVSSQREIVRVRDALAAALGAGVEVHSWADLQPMLVYLVEMFDAFAWYVYAAIFVAMGFGIANVLLMAVFERTREIGMLLAMGMRRGRVVALVVIESLVVTLFGLALGLGLAVACVYALRDGIDLSAFAEGLTAYGIGTRLVPVLRPADFGVPLVIAGIAALLASAWPALRAGSARPAEALRRS